MSEIKEINAIIKSARIKTDDGFLDCLLDLDYVGSGQGFGGYALYLPKSWRKHYKNAPHAGHFIWRVMQIAGVVDFDSLRGKAIRVRQEHSKIHAIGHIINDDWFSPSDDFSEIEKSEAA